MALRAGDDLFSRRENRSFLGLADRAGQSPLRASGREPPLAMAFWGGFAADTERFRRSRRAALSSGTARLARRGVCAAQLQHERNASAHGHFGGLSACFGS